MGEVIVRTIRSNDAHAWRIARCQLWPEVADESEPDSATRFFQGDSSAIGWDGGPSTVLVAEDEAGRLIGFMELGTRPFAEGCDVSPVAYVEGWWVAPDERQRGIGSALLQAAEDWAARRHYRVLASDCLVSNSVSERAHHAAGFFETERLIHFIKPLNRGS